MQSSETEVRELEALILNLSEGHSRLAELVERQREAIRKADTRALDEVGRRIGEQVRRLADIEAIRREVCDRLAIRLGLATGESASGGRLKLEAFSRRIGGQWGQRLRQAARQLAAQMERVRRAGQLNQTVARRLVEFFADLLGQIARLGRETGCYDAKGRRSLAREPIGANRVLAVG